MPGSMGIESGFCMSAEAVLASEIVNIAAQVRGKYKYEQKAYLNIKENVLMSCGGVQPWYNNYKILGKFFMYWKYTKMSKKILNN